MVNRFRIDPAVDAFMAKARLTGGTQFAALDYLVTATKQTTIWNKMIALWPMVGGNATAHSYNLMNPVNNNSGYTISWSGNWIHSATGAKPSGVTTCFADTHLIPKSALTQNSASIGFYSRTQNTALQQPIGAADTGYVNRFEIAYNSGLFLILNTSSTAVSYVPTNTLGLMQGSRTSSGTVNIVKNGVNTFSTTANTSSGLANSSMYIGAENDGGVVSLPSTWECAFAYVAQGLTVAEMIAFDAIITKYQTILGRQ